MPCIIMKKIILSYIITLLWIFLSTLVFICEIKRMSPKKFTPPAFGEKASLPDMVADYLAGEIERGTFKTGETLAPELELADQFGVSRTVIREALARLKHDGLLESRQRVGAMVAAPYQKRAFRLGKLNPQDPQMLGHLYEVRAILEAGSAYLAAQRRTDEDLDQFREYLDHLTRAIEKGKHGTSFDLAFHHHLTEATHNPLLKELVNFLNAKVSQMIQIAREKSDKLPELARSVHQEHEELFIAIENQDSKRAMRLAWEHLESGARRQNLPSFRKKEE